MTIPPMNERQKRQCWIDDCILYDDDTGSCVIGYLINDYKRPELCNYHITPEEYIEAIDSGMIP
jgi:hypothetical protein